MLTVTQCVWQALSCLRSISRPARRRGTGHAVVRFIIVGSWLLITASLLLSWLAAPDLRARSHRVLKLIGEERINAHQAAMSDRPLRPPPRVECRKDVPDGKNFRVPPPSLAVAAACAPGHKTAQGHQGRTDPEEMKRKKAEKQMRKRLQAEREEANRRKRAREQGLPMPDSSSRPYHDSKSRPPNPDSNVEQGLSDPHAPGAAASGQDEQQGKRQKTNGSANQRSLASSSGQYRNRLNLCCKDNDFGAALLVLDEMRLEHPEIELSRDQYVQLLHLCSSSTDSQHWLKGEQLLQHLEELERKEVAKETADAAQQATQDKGRGRCPPLSEAMASGIIRMTNCLGHLDKALDTWNLVLQNKVTRKRRMYAALLELLAKHAAKRYASPSHQDKQGKQEEEERVEERSGKDGEGVEGCVGLGGKEVDLLALGLSILGDAELHQVDLLQVACSAALAAETRKSKH